MIVCFEGVNGAGKSTQISLLCAALRKIDRPFVVMHDPGINDDHICQELRRLFVYGDRWKDARTALLIGCAARSELTYEIRRAASNTPDMVIILDRYEMSTYAYQTLMLEDAGFSLDEAWTWIRNLGTMIECVKVDHLVLLDPPVDIAYARRHSGRRSKDDQRDDQFEQRGLLFATRLRQRYFTTLDNSEITNRLFKNHICVPYLQSTTPEEVFQVYGPSLLEHLN